MKKRHLYSSLLAAILLGLLANGTPLLSAPKPAMVLAQGDWQLDFEIHGQPQQIQVRLPGEKETRHFWYFLYTITNNSDQEVDFYPHFELFTDTLKIYTSPPQIRKPVFQAIRKLYAKSIPLLEPTEQVMGRLQIGSDNARDSVAIFEDFDPNAAQITLFVSGLSNESVTVQLPDSTENKNAATKILLRKTLGLNYQIPGDRYNLDQRVMLYRDRNWVMR